MESQLGRFSDEDEKIESADEPTVDELEASEEEVAIGDAGPSWN